MQHKQKENFLQSSIKCHIIKWTHLQYCSWKGTFVWSIVLKRKKLSRAPVDFYAWALGRFHPLQKHRRHLCPCVHTCTYNALSWQPWKGLLITIPLASIIAAQSWPVDPSLSQSPCFTNLHPSYTHKHTPTLQSCDAYIFTPPHYKYHYVWLYLLPSHQGCRWPSLITLIKAETCVFFMRVCV